MKITFLGGADEVGASSTLVEVAGKTLLIDAGIRISPRTSRGIEGDQLPDLHPITEAGGIDYLLVTHAHTDHTGALPLVVERYPHVPVMATPPTIALTRVLQADAQRIMRAKHEEEGELPIFDEVASGRLLEAFQEVPVRQAIKLGDGLQITYHVSGHIAGAASILIESEEGTLLMSGDVSLPAQRAVVGALVPRVKPNALVLESTYGGRLHANRAVEEKRLIETLQGVIARGGKALIPAFALGRAQEVIQILLAHRDTFDAPVYVDGMVRAVCRAYTGFADWLPEATVRAAGDDALFFRKNIKPVETAEMRQQVMAGGPCVIVASSGMLTGGASQAYAKELAPDARNAILLTGYQDEEAPGKFLQRLMRERQAGEEVAWKLDAKTTVALRAEINTYSLSAHADENELLSVVNSLDPEDTFLVHGDPSARHSLATGIRSRGRVVHQPKSGQTYDLRYKRRPVAMGKLATGGETRPVSVSELWAALKVNAGSYYGANELARMWWGDEGRGAEIAAAITADALHFAPDWRKKNTFMVRSPEQVEKITRQRAILAQHPDLIGKLVVLRDSNQRPRAGVVVGAGAESFEAVVEQNKGRNYPGDALLWVVGPWDGPPEGRGMKERLGALAKQARALKDAIVPYERRQVLIGREVNPRDLLPADLPEEVPPDVALLSVVLALASDGATQSGGGLTPRRALEGAPAEQNVARQIALDLFPAEARLRKVGMETHRTRMLLYFDFPERAATLYADEIEALEDQTGWSVVVNPAVSQQALGMAANELLPTGLRIVKGPAYFMDRREVSLELDAEGDEAAVQVNHYSKAYLELTGYRLKAILRNVVAPIPTLSAEETPDAGPVPAVGTPGVLSAPVPDLPPGSGRMEINAAYTVIRRVLEPYGMYKSGLKGSEIVLSFISPQVGQRHTDAMLALSRHTGYGLSVHPHPNQQMILQVANRLFRESGWSVRKGPGIHVDRAELAVGLNTTPDPAQVAQVSEAFFVQTGYRLRVE